LRETLSISFLYQCELKFSQKILWHWLMTYFQCSFLCRLMYACWMTWHEDFCHPMSIYLVLRNDHEGKTLDSIVMNSCCECMNSGCLRTCAEILYQCN
jgi:hypothetical protein